MADDFDRRRAANVNRRVFLADTGLGFTGLVLGAMAQKQARAEEAWHPPDGKPHFEPKAKNVIWLFMLGGVSHLESFDPKPALNVHANKTIQETPLAGVLDSPFTKKNVRSFIMNRELWPRIMPLQAAYQKHGQSGIEVSDWFPKLAGCVDDMAVVRSMYTTDNDHGAVVQFHTGRNILEGFFPTVGSWASYGLGSLNENLPQFVVLGQTQGSFYEGSHGASYLGPEYSGVRLEVDPKNPLAFATPGDKVFREEQEGQFRLIQDLNGLAALEYPADPALRARIKSYELAYRMQTAVPSLFQFQEERQATRKMYGLDQDVTRPFGERLLAARRLVERGVRFVQVYHGVEKGFGSETWDAHQNLRTNHAKLASQVDLPIAGLLKDLKERGLLDETVVVWATEFGRTPQSESRPGFRGNGRDHHPYGFSIWMAGAGIKKGVVEGATDELGFHAVENRHYVTDIHATVLKLLGLDAHKLVVPGRQRLEIDFGRPIDAILS